jgi:hypothetical protein
MFTMNTEIWPGEAGHSKLPSSWDTLKLGVAGSQWCIVTHCTQVRPAAMFVFWQGHIHVSNMGQIMSSYCRLTHDFCRSLEDPPTSPMFQGGREKKPNQVQALTSCMTEMAKAMASSSPHTQAAESTSAGPLHAPVGISPGKMANLWSNYLQQLRDLHALLESGAINDSEFQDQKATVLEQLKNYKDHKPSTQKWYTSWFYIVLQFMHDYTCSTTNIQRLSSVNKRIGFTLMHVE